MANQSRRDQVGRSAVDPSHVVDDPDVLDVLIVGGGPAGLSAALILGRCRRRVLVCDDGHPRNEKAPQVHGYLGVPAANPDQLRALGKQQISAHRSVSMREVRVVNVTPVGGGDGAAGSGFDGFVAELADGQRVRARKLLLASGVVDLIPEVPGLAPLWGRSVFPCPYCDGWEFRGRRFGALGAGPDAVAQCRALTRFGDDIILFTNGDTKVDDEEYRALVRWGARIVTEPVRAVEAVKSDVLDGPSTLRLLFEGGPEIPRDALFVTGPQRQRSPLARQLGCPLTEKGVADTKYHQKTQVPGVFIAGDAARDVQFAIIAAAEGAAAAFEINRELLHEEFAVPERRQRQPAGGVSE